MQPLALIVARARNGVIGAAGALPWRLPEDLKHFRRVTTGHAIVMGRKTYDSIGRPLPERRNIVVSRQAGLTIAGCEVARSLSDALALARATDAEPIVIGGAELYREALPLATRLYLTEVHVEPAGDAYFPTLDETQWDETSRREGDGATFRELVRRPAR